MKDLSIEQSLKTYEEVWLSKIFQFHIHIRSKMASSEANLPVSKINTRNNANMPYVGSDRILSISQLMIVLAFLHVLALLYILKENNKLLL